MLKPSWHEAFKYAAIAAGIEATIKGSLSIYQKIKSGKKLSEFTIQDWKDVGYDFGKGGIGGGFSGLSIYGLMRLADMPSPFAGAIVGLARGIISLTWDYRKGKISKEDFADCACSLSVETGLVSIGAAIGQAAIPVPVLGAIIGSVSANVALNVCKKVVGNKENELIAELKKQQDALLAKLNKEEQRTLAKVQEYYDRLGGLIAASYSKVSVVRLTGSIELCRFLKVPENEIIHNIEELDLYMTQ